MNKTFAFTLRWSQTDSEIVCIQAKNKLEAQNKMKLRFPNAISGPAYIEFVGEIRSL